MCIQQFVDREKSCLSFLRPTYTLLFAEFDWRSSKYPRKLSKSSEIAHNAENWETLHKSLKSALKLPLQSNFPPPTAEIDPQYPLLPVKVNLTN